MKRYLQSVPTLQLRFSAACSYRASTDQGFARQAETLNEVESAGLEDSELFSLVQRHRIHALAWDTLVRHGRQGLMGVHQETLRAQALEVRKSGLLMGLLCHSVVVALRKKGVESHLFKGGPLLSKKLYGDLGLRQCKDLDFIVKPDDLATSIECFREQGWVSDHPPLWQATPHHRWLAKHVLRDIAFRDPKLGIEIELHHRFERIHDPRRESDWWGGFSDVVDDRLSEVEFLYLCLHGATHGWNRMKWLGDIAAAVERRPGIYQECAPLARRLELEHIFLHVQGLLEALYGIGGQAVSLNSHTLKQVRFCLERLSDPDSSEVTISKALIRVKIDLFRQSLLGKRLSVGRQLLHNAIAVLVRPKDIELLGRHWVWLLCLPVVRFTSILVRYLLQRRKAAG